MMAEQIDIKRSLMSVDIFRGLSEAQISVIAAWFKEVKIEPWQPLFSDRDPEEDFYIIQTGKVFVAVGDQEDVSTILSAGEHFTEADLLFGHPDTAYITTDQPTHLLMLEAREFRHMVAAYPQIKPWLARNIESRQLVGSRDFEWVGKDEVIYFIARKHIVMFLFSLIGPIVLGVLSFSILYLASGANGQTTWIYGLACSSLILLAAFIWVVWDWVDWGNDYYIVTDQRVVWLEKVVFLYESRDEAPLNTILAVNSTSTLMGRIFNYGDVIVKTFTGEITFRKLKDPKRMAAIIEEYRARLVKGSERREKREINKLLRQRLGLEVEDEEALPPPGIPGDEQKDTVPSEEEKQKQKGFMREYLGTFFMMRFEEGDVITYRKYWPTLFGKIWIPTVLILAFILGIGILISLYFSDATSAQFTLFAILFALLMILIIFVPWWLYRYVDWRNDIYQVTDRNIIDIERRPLGTEVKKSAPVENILSLEHERVGFLGYMLNYGFVTINVGETQFVFRNVHDPARVQQDIFNRIYALQRHKEEMEAVQRRQRFVDVIGVYHESFEELEGDEYFVEEYDEDFGVELGPDDYP